MLPYESANGRPLRALNGGYRATVPFKSLHSGTLLPPGGYCGGMSIVVSGWAAGSTVLFVVSSGGKAGVCFGWVGTSGMGIEVAVASEMAATMTEAASALATGNVSASMDFASSMCWRLASRCSMLPTSPFPSASVAGGGRFFFSWLLFLLLLLLPSLSPLTSIAPATAAIAGFTLSGEEMALATALRASFALRSFWRRSALDSNSCQSPPISASLKMRVSTGFQEKNKKKKTIRHGLGQTYSTACRAGGSSWVK